MYRSISLHVLLKTMHCDKIDYTKGIFTMMIHATARSRSSGREGNPEIPAFEFGTWGWSVLKV